MPAAVPFGPTGKTIFERTYSRVKEDGGRENWYETVDRVAAGNLALVYGPAETWDSEVNTEFARLTYYMENFALLPAGRHLWATGVEGRQFIQNCWVSGFDGDRLSSHFRFTFLRLMEGGGVGANYSSKYLEKFGAPKNGVNCAITANAWHKDYEELKPHLALGGWPDGRIWVVEDSREGWADALADLIDSAYTGFMNRNYDVSKVRPSGSELKTFGGTASGPAPFARMMHEVAAVLNKARTRGSVTPLDAMEIDHAIAECVVSGGNRRSARMAIVHWNDPYIMNFINCKQDTGKHWTTNISVEIDDRFLLCLKQPYADNDPDFARAKQVHQAVCKAVLENGEPGYWNSSLSSKGETGTVISTNPCGEICLESGEACTLGHVNLDWFHDMPWEYLEEAHRLMTRFLIRATFADISDPESRRIMDRNRRIGVGHLGVQGYWAKRGVRYSGIPTMAPVELRTLYKTVRQEAREYAFQLRIPEPVKVTTVAPTGSIAKLPGVSEGIHPVYSRYFERRVRFSKRDEAQFATVMEAMAQGFTVEDDVYDQSGMTAVVVYPTEDLLLSQVRALGLPDSVVQSADELSIHDMLSVQKVYQEYWADNSVSYTVNIPEGSVTAEELAEMLAQYLPVLKGTTVMVDASRPQAPYTRITKEEYQSAVVKTVEDSTDENCAQGACPVR